MTRFISIALLAAMLLAGCSSEPAELAGIVRSPLPDVSQIVLPDASAGGADFKMVAPEGEYLIVYFGYTACPDVCPTTMADLRSALEDLGDDASRVNVAMATVDPDRDSAEIVTGYVQSFIAGSHGLRTDDADLLRSAADVFGADYGVTVADDAYDVIHTAHLYAVDDAGLLQVSWAFGTEPDTIASDLKILLGSG